MTVKELVDVSDFCDILEITVRSEGHGRWIQGYRIGQNVELFPADINPEVIEKLHLDRFARSYVLEEGQEVDTVRGRDLPMKIICKDVHKIPDYIGNLRICCVWPFHVYPLHKNTLTKNNHGYDICCYPECWEEPEDKPKEVVLKGQMSLEEMMR